LLTGYAGGLAGLDDWDKFDVPGLRGISKTAPYFVNNSAATLDVQLAALAAQDFDGGWELVVVDNASTDTSRDIATRWVPRLPCLRVVTEPRVGLNRARNRGVRAAVGNLIVVCDADDEVSPGWLRAMIDGMQRFDVVGGALEPLPNPATRWRPEIMTLPIPRPGARRYSAPMVPSHE